MGCASSTEAAATAVSNTAASTKEPKTATISTAEKQKPSSNNSNEGQWQNDEQQGHNVDTNTSDTNVKRKTLKSYATETTDDTIETCSNIDTMSTISTATNTNANNTSPNTTTPTSSEGVIRIGPNACLRYACLTHKGFDPENVSKSNQDSYGVHEGLVATSQQGLQQQQEEGQQQSSSSSSFFGVYDGHGPDGHLCSQYVKRELPNLIEDYIVNNTAAIRKQKQKSGTISDQAIIEASLQDAHVTCNDKLRSNKHINDLYSGTTAVSIYVHSSNNSGDDDNATKDDGAVPLPKITVCNVGDSRAIVGTRLPPPTASETIIKAVPLTKDQTPYRQDEAQRCIQSGARILTFGQIDPNNHPNDDKDDDDDGVEDPPRVWSTKGNYPGTAFTRSIGDAIAQQIGVIAVPELMTLSLTSNELYLVLATDGVFDILDNQQVIDICNSNSNSNNNGNNNNNNGGNDDDNNSNKMNPAAACQEIIKQSRDGWIQNEIETDDDQLEAMASYDDMTVICIFIDHTSNGEEDDSNTRTGDDATTNADCPSDVAKDAPESTQPHQPSTTEGSTSSTTTTGRRRTCKRVRQKTLRNLEEAILEETSLEE